MTQRFVISDENGHRRVLDDPNVADLTTSGLASVNTAAADVGDAVYLASNNAVGQAHQDVTANSVEADVVGFVESVNVVRIEGEITVAGWGLTPTGRYYLSSTPGQITTTPPTTGWLVPVGYAKTANTLVIKYERSVIL